MGLFQKMFFHGPWLPPPPWFFFWILLYEASRPQPATQHVHLLTPEAGAADDGTGERGGEIHTPRFPKANRGEGDGRFRVGWLGFFHSPPLTLALSAPPAIHPCIHIPATRLKTTRTCGARATPLPSPVCHCLAIAMHQQLLVWSGHQQPWPCLLVIH